jgi:predicted outer membrane repeat protein
MFSNSSLPTLTNVIISGNFAYEGGGVYSGTSSSPVLTSVTISGNHAAGTIEGGGGMYINSSSPALTNVTISGNTASTNGGGIYNSSPLKLTNVTISGNVAGNYGGGIYNTNSNYPAIRNSIIWGNTAATGSTIYNAIGQPDIWHSIIEGSGGSGSGWVNAMGSDDGNNLDINPQFAAPAAGDYHLTVNSPAINAGNNNNYPVTTGGGWNGDSPVYSAYNAISLASLKEQVRLALAKDSGGADRFRGTAIDMGAFEEPGGISSGIPAITLTIDDAGQGAFSQGTFTINKTGNQSQTVNLESGEGYSSPVWYVDGVQAGTGTSVTVNAADYAVGGHSLSLVVQKGGVPWSKSITFTVEN